MPSLAERRHRYSTICGELVCPDFDQSVVVRGMYTSRRTRDSASLACAAVSISSSLWSAFAFSRHSPDEPPELPVVADDLFAKVLREFHSPSSFPATPTAKRPLLSNTFLQDDILTVCSWSHENPSRGDTANYLTMLLAIEDVSIKRRKLGERPQYELRISAIPRASQTQRAKQPNNTPPGVAGVAV